jgi:hypothetical protein
MANPKDVERARAGDKHLSEADLSGADLRDENLSEADLRDANLENARLQRADLSDSDMRRANLKGATLFDAILRNTYLPSADLRGADLTDADLTGASLYYANLTGANLTAARFRGAILTGAIGLPPGLLSGDSTVPTPAAKPAPRVAPAPAAKQMQRYNVGLFLNPVSFEMATGTYDSQSSKVRVWAICRDKYSSEIAIGSIDDGSMYGGSYKQSAERTGYPRAHASPGVESEYRKQRWGTCLYVAEAETTRAHKEGQLEYKPGVTGSLDGVSSKPGTRSPDAEKWWTLAKKDGLAKSVRKCDAGQQNEIERALYLSKGDDPKLDAFVLKLSKARHKQDPIAKSSKFVELRRYTMSAVYVESKDNCDAFDILTSISCREHKLVAAACGKQSLLQYPGEPPLFWQLSDDNIANDFVYKSGTTRDALLSANVGYLATEDFGKKAMENYVKIMRAVRCSDEQIRDKVALFNAKVDVTAPEYIRQEWMVQNPPAVDVIRRRGRKVEYLMSNPKHAIVPTKIAPPRIVFYGPRPNPDALPKGVQKALERLYDRRLESGYGALQNLP